MKLITSLILILTFLSSSQAQLQGYNIDIEDSSTSGISAGGYMAVQVHMAFSDQFMGAGIVAGGPMMCAMGNVNTALLGCMSLPSQINLNTINSKVLKQQNEGTIDNLQNIKGQNVYLYSGTKDTTVKPGVMEKLDQQYTQLGANIKKVFDIPSQHAWITDNYGSACDKNKSPYINNCDYNQARDILEHIYGDLNPSVEQVSSNLIKFSQNSYISSGDSLNSEGYVYIPTSCQNGEKCKVHVAFHGCKMTLKDIGTQFVINSGLNEVAESNNIIVLYPQAKSSLLSPSNPNGCFDWWGYTDGGLPISTSVKYATKEGKQMQAVFKMLKALDGSNFSQTEQVE